MKTNRRSTSCLKISRNHHHHHHHHHNKYSTTTMYHQCYNNNFILVTMLKMFFLSCLLLVLQQQHVSYNNFVFCSAFQQSQSQQQQHLYHTTVRPFSTITTRQQLSAANCNNNDAMLKLRRRIRSSSSSSSTSSRSMGYIHGSTMYHLTSNHHHDRRGIIGFPLSSSFEQNPNTNNSDGSSSSSSNNNNNKKNNKNQQQLRKLRTVMKTILIKQVTNWTTWKVRTITNFKKLSDRSKRLLFFQGSLMFVALLSFTNNVYQYNVKPLAPIEISYSSFLNLIENQKYLTSTTSPITQSTLPQQPVAAESVMTTTTTAKTTQSKNNYFTRNSDNGMITMNPTTTTSAAATTTATTTSNVNAANAMPLIVRNIQIGTDRYIYRLYPSNHPTVLSSTSSLAATGSSSITAATGTSPTTTTTTETKTEPVDSTAVHPFQIFTSALTPSPSSTSSLSSLSSIKRNQKILIKKQEQLQKRIMKREYITAFTRTLPTNANQLNIVTTLRDNDVSFTALPLPKPSVLVVTIRSTMITFYFVILFRLYKTISGAGGGGGGGGFGANGNSNNDVPGKLAGGKNAPELTTTFNDIQGMDDVKLEVMELVDTLRNPEKYTILGARAPTGLLLEGPPGTGKTMLARATAATVGVPLLYCSGSDFVEMFVGRGAARVRKLFEKAEKMAPCIIFIDELDALGKSRDMGNNFGGMNGPFSRSNDEAEQTLNQLLACMDGLDSTRRVCVLAATNRKEVLDPALVRPGRFDRIVKLKLPDVSGREAILRVHAKKLPGFMECTGVDPKRSNSLGMGRAVDLTAIAAVTDGFSGAELEYLVNEAAIRAVRRVSRSLQKGTPTMDIVPHVDAMDFEDSLQRFYATRRSNNRGGPNNLFKNVFN